jgi:predicted  nucleic acid-binding Zn-ribbon protein
MDFDKHKLESQIRDLEHKLKREKEDHEQTKRKLRDSDDSLEKAKREIRNLKNG